ncbi:MAG: fimbrial protein [Deltaproteobacteria bacterium]|nr:fimbrial protein [Deltaproteobacteria bacterium]
MKMRFGLLAAVIALGYVSGAHAATSGSVTIQGTVPTVVAITVTGIAPFNALDLTTTQANLPVADVVEQSNDSLGYKVTMSSTNAGSLKNGSLGSVAYTAKYNGTTVTLSATPQQVTSTGSTTAVVNATKSLTISYTGAASASLMSGTYSDTLTFTIAAN